MIKIQEIHPNLYIFSTSFKLFGVELGNRMTVVKNENNDLWVHSPININQDTVNQLQKMGNVHSIISPNLLHHLHLAKFIKYFPNIPVYGVDGIEKKQKDVSFQLLPINLWGADIKSIRIEGMPSIKETVFFHQASKTLIVTDLVFNVSETMGWSKVVWSAYGVNHKLKVSPLFKFLIKHKPKFNQSIQQLLQWDFENVILSHGNIILGNGKQQLESALQKV